MVYIVNAIAWLLSFFTKKGLMTALTLPIKIAIYTFVGVAITAYVGGIVMFFGFILELVNNFYSYINNFNSLNMGSGSAYGLSLSTIWQMFIGFMSASGLGNAIYISTNLFLTLLFGYLIVKITRQVGEVFKETAKILSSSGSMLG